MVNATHGEFETGFELGGQTREHTILIRSLGKNKRLTVTSYWQVVEVSWWTDCYEYAMVLESILIYTWMCKFDWCSGLLCWYKM